MSVRFWRSFGLAVLIACVTAIAVSAKGGYSFITIAGADLNEAVRSSDTALTEDFFAFADFYRDRVEAPADPGVGYEITRYYLDGTREIAFDRLHYYPVTGFVYYDGIVNGSSEYDGEWYAARPGIRSVFEAALPGVLINQPQAIDSEKDTPSQTVTDSTQQNAAPDQRGFILVIAIAAGLVLTILGVFSGRKVHS